MRALPAALALLAAISAGHPAGAQETPEVISPLKVELDHNNVNLLTGKTEIDMPVLTAPGAGRLRFDRVQNAAPYIVSVYSAGDPDQASSSHSVHTGAGTSESFQCSGVGNCESATGTGSMIEGLQDYRQAGSGALWNFSVKRYDTRPNTNARSQYYASSVEYPDGERISYDYGSATVSGQLYYRPTAIATTLGYLVTLTYHSDLGESSDWGHVKEAALYGPGSSNPIQKFSYSADGATITDIGGRVYRCGGCRNQMGIPAEASAGSFQLPGEASPALQVASHPSEPVVATVIRDGVGWSYSYTNLRLNAHASGYLYDKLTVTGPDGFHAVHDLAVRQLTLGGVQTNVLTGSTSVLAESTNPFGRRTAYGFDAASRPVSVTLPEGNKVTVAYDGRGNVIAKTTIPKGGGPGFTETAYYDELKCDRFVTPVLCFRPDYVRDGLGRQTDFLYNAHGQLVEQTDPPDQYGRRKKTYVTYDESSGIRRKSVVRMCLQGSTCGTNQEIRTEYLYWGQTSLPSRERRIEGYYGRVRDTGFSYDPAGRLLVKDGPLPGTDDALYSRYDVHGRKSWEIGARSPEGLRIATRFTYRDSDDKLLYSETGTLPDAQSEALSVFSRSDFAYDPHRNPIRVAVSAGGAVRQVTDQSWDDRGRLVCTAVRMNPDSFAEQPGACFHSTPGGQGPDRIGRNQYDSIGQLIRVEKGVGTPLRQDYAKYEYTLNGLRGAVTDANGNRAEMGYDGFDRLRRWTFPSNTPGSVNPGDYEEYGYDPIGNRTRLRKRDGSELGYVYDNLDRVIRKIVPERSGLAAAQTRDVFYDYNHALGLQTHARFDSLDGEGVTMWYDAFGQSTTTLSTMGGQARYVTYYHDDAGNPHSISHPDGVAFDSDHDALGRVTAVYEHRASPSMDDYLVRYWYNPAGNRHSAVRGAGSGGFYAIWYRDPLERPAVLANDLPGAGDDMVVELGYNAASQIIGRGVSNDSHAAPPPANAARGYGVNGLNQYIGTTWGGAPNWSFEYDPNGNLKRSVDPAGTGTVGYLYDVENRLVAASGAASAALVYDPLGRLFEVAGAGGAKTRFLYDGDRMIAEYDGSGTLTRRYVHGPGADEPVAVYEGPELGLANRRYTMTDERGSIAALVDADGSPWWKNRYDAWGVPGDNRGRFQYTGQAWIGELGLYYYKARFYSPWLGRFMQTDPIGYEGGINLYGYVDNDPVNAADPEGTDKVQCNVVDNVASGCTYSADNDESTTVTYIEKTNYTDGYGRDQTSTRVTTETYEGSISKEGVFSRVVMGTGKSIMGGIERTLSALTGSKVTVTAAITALPSPRQSLMERAQSTRVQGVVNELYRPGAKIGRGSSMDAYRANGSHKQKLQERRTQIQNMLKKDKSLSARDRAVLRDLLNDINDALD